MIGNSHVLNMRDKYHKIKKLFEVDYKIFSQNGEDGILDYLLYQLEIQKPKFLEIGVGDYSECNTRFIFERCSPKGTIIDLLNNLEEKVKKNVLLGRKNPSTDILKMSSQESFFEMKLHSLRSASHKIFKTTHPETKSNLALENGSFSWRCHRRLEFLNRDLDENEQSVGMIIINHRIKNFYD